MKPEIDEVLKDGNEAIESGQLGKLKRQGVRTSMKSLKELLDSKEQNAIARRKEYVLAICPVVWWNRLSWGGLVPLFMHILHILIGNVSMKIFHLRISPSLKFKSGGGA